MSLENIAQFLIYLSPGFLVVALYHKRYPVRKESDFYIGAWSLVYGGLILAGVTLLDSWLSWDFHTASVICADTAKEVGSTPPDLKLLMSLYAGSLVFVSMMIITREFRFWASNRYKRLKKLAPDPQAVWAEINLSLNPDWAVVYLDDDSIYTGYISSYTFDPNAEYQDFLLADAKRVDDDLTTDYLVDGTGVYLNSRNVRRIEFLQPDKPSKDPKDTADNISASDARNAVIVLAGFYSLLLLVTQVFSKERKPVNHSSTLNTASETEAAAD